jgi:hypothetical protein
MSQQPTSEHRSADARALAAAYLAEISRSGVEVASLAAAAFQSELLAASYGDRFLPCPLFLEPGESDQLGKNIVLMHRLLADLPARLYGGDRRVYCRAIGLSEPQTELVTRSADGPLPVLARADLYRSREGFKLLELNNTSAIGGSEHALLNRAMLENPLLANFVRARGLTFADPFQAIVRSILRQLGDRVIGRRPVVALADWPESYRTYAPRLAVMAQLMAELEIEAIPCHVGEITTCPGGLAVHGRPIDLVYRFFLLEEIVNQSDLALVEPIISAVERGEVVIFSRMDAEAYGNKGALAMLSDDRHADSFSATERDMIERYLPWTRYVRPLLTDPAGERVPAEQYAQANREQLVLKPVNQHGGTGVLPGWQVSPQQWAAAVDRAVNGPWVLQQRVHPEPEAFPRADADGYTDVYFNWGVFVVEPDLVGGSGYAGCLGRGSPEQDVGVVSMDAGAMVACCFYPAEQTR